MNLKNVLTAAAAILIFSSAAGAAQTPTRMNQFNAWGTYSYSGSDGKICYVLSTPATSSSSSRRSRARAYPTSRRSSWAMR